jgi:ABC-type multidrug transport system permease subunit
MSDYLQLRQLGLLISAHFKEIIREPGVLFWGIGFPILITLGLGVAFTKKSDVVRKVVFVQESGAAGGPEKILQTRAEKDSLPAHYRIAIPDSNLGNTTFLFQPADWAQAMILLKRGTVSLVLAGSGEQPEYHFDPLNPDAQLSFLKLSKILGGRGSPAEGGGGIIKPLDKVGTRYIDFLVPGLMAMGIMMSCLWGISYGLIEKRGKKLLRRMVATPMRKSYFLLSLMAVRMTMNLVEWVLLVLFAHVVFGITIQGNPLALLTLFLAGNLAFAGIAVLMCCRTAKAEIGNGVISAVSMPMMILSGIFFSYQNFPEWSIPVIRYFPLTLLADSIRSVFIEGAGFAGILFPAAVLAAMGGILFLAGLRLFRWN